MVGQGGGGMVVGGGRWEVRGGEVGRREEGVRGASERRGMVRVDRCGGESRW